MQQDRPMAAFDVPDTALVTYTRRDDVARHRRTALAWGRALFDLDALRRSGTPGVEPAWVVGGVRALLDDWGRARAWLNSAPTHLQTVARQDALQPLRAAHIKVEAPLVPNRLFCVAANYAEHAAEMDNALAAKANSLPYLFAKLPSSVVGDGDDIVLPPEVTQLDWEVELAVVVGRPGRRLKVEEALSHVAGYTVLNDISARNLNARTDVPFRNDWFQSKSHDTFAPMGPCLVPAQRIPDPQDVSLWLDVNGQAMQRGHTAAMIWSVAELLAYLSTIVTLQPGDVVATGTPSGVGRSRGVFLQPGDVVTAGAVGVGCIGNRVCAERASD